MDLIEHRSFWLLLLVGLLGLFAVLVESGRRLRQSMERAKGPSVATSLGGVEAAVFSLLGLLLAFSFTSAAGRFDGRRQLVVDEANALGTAYLRLNLVAPDVRPVLQARFREYVDARIAGYGAIPDTKAALAHFQRAAELQKPLWESSVEACARAPDSRAAILLLPALNTSFDIATTRMAMIFLHPPRVVFALLLALSILCAIFAGWSMGGAKERSVLHAAGFVVALALTLYLTLDIELPRMGLVTVESFDAVLTDARARMK